MEVVGQITGGLSKEGIDPDGPSHVHAPAGHEFPRSAISPADTSMLTVTLFSRPLSGLECITSPT
jgi:hypothetical protein